MKDNRILGHTYGRFSLPGIRGSGAGRCRPKRVLLFLPSTPETPVVPILYRHSNYSLLTIKEQQVASRPDFVSLEGDRSVLVSALEIVLSVAITIQQCLGLPIEARMLTTHIRAVRTGEEVSFLPCVVRNTIVLSLAAFTTSVFVGCGGNSSGGNTQHNKAVVSVQVAPLNPSIVVGSQQQFKATAVFDDASQQDVTSSATWTSSELTKAGVNNSGIATSVDIG